MRGAPLGDAEAFFMFLSGGVWRSEKGSCILAPVAILARCMDSLMVLAYVEGPSCTIGLRDVGHIMRTPSQVQILRSSDDALIQIVATLIYTLE